MHPAYVKPWLSFPPQPQRQDSLNDQLRELAMVAARLGMYDAGDFIQRTLHPNRNWGTVTHDDRCFDNPDLTPKGVVLADEAEYQDGVRCVVMPCCAFTFDAIHLDDKSDPPTYTCPQCGEESAPEPRTPTDVHGQGGVPLGAGAPARTADPLELW